MISTNLAQRPIEPLIRVLIGGTQPFHGWWAPVAQRYKKGGGGRGTRHKIHLRRHNPTYILTLSRSREGTLPATGSTATAHRRLCTASLRSRLHRVTDTDAMASSSSLKAADGLLPHIPLFLSLCFLALDHVLGFTLYPKCQFDPLDLWQVDPVNQSSPTAYGLMLYPNVIFWERKSP